MSNPREWLKALEFAHLDEPMKELLAGNRHRKWAGDPLTGPET